MPVDQHIGDNTAVEFLEGTLPEADQARVEAHAARCHDCRQHLAALGRMESQDDQVPTAPLGQEAHIALERGEKVGQFEILSRIGSGGMGVVFAAYDPRLGRKVALKLLRSPRDSGLSVSDAQRRFLREAQAMAQLSHPNVIAVYDVGRYKSEVYIAMELVEGETLTRWLRRWKRPWREILDKFLAAGGALAEAHGSGLAHRDFKPDNVLVGSDERVRVMDFGLVRSLFFDVPQAGGDGQAPAGTPRASMLGHALTRTGALMGTPRYMAPEQLEGGETEARSDQFSFCVALYEALYGQHPFEGDTAMGLDADSRLRPPPSDTDVPSWLHKALVRGLSFKAKDRFPTMRDLLRAITPPPLRPPRTRLAIAAGMFGIALIYSVAAWFQARSESEKLGSEVGMARARVAELEQEVKDLLRHVERLEGQSGAQQADIEALQQRLSEASTALARAEQVLAQQQAGGVPGLAPGLAPAAATTSGPGATAAVVTPQARAPAPGSSTARPPRSSGLTRAELVAPLEPHQLDLHVCFREWLERVPDQRLLLGVRLRIEPGGVPAVGKIGGIDDHVMRECVTGNLLRLRFPARDVVTVADYKFLRGADGALETTADVTEVQAPAAGTPP
jgi:serine/threonine protein kinase